MQWHGLPAFGTCKDVVCGHVCDNPPQQFSLLVESIFVLCNEKCSWLLIHQERDKRELDSIEAMSARTYVHKKDFWPHCFFILSGLPVWTEFQGSISECHRALRKFTFQKGIRNWPGNELLKGWGDGGPKAQFNKCSYLHVPRSIFEDDESLDNCHDSHHGDNYNNDEDNAWIFESTVASDCIDFGSPVHHQDKFPDALFYIHTTWLCQE